MTKEFDRIILPIDGSNRAKNAAKKAITIAKNRNIDIHAIHILHHSYLFIHPEMYPTMEKKIMENAIIYLNEIEQIGKKMGIKIMTKIIEGIPYEEIIKFAHKDDLIVMGNKGKTGLEKILIGGVAEKVIRHAPCDVLIVKTD